MVRERDVEAWLRRQIEKRGGLCLKWVSPGNDGVPDRIIIMPHGLVFFAEIKTDEGRPSEKQTYMINKLRKLGCRSCFIYGKEGAEAFINALDAVLVEGGDAI